VSEAPPPFDEQSPPDDPGAEPRPRARRAELVRTLSQDGGLAVRALIGSNLIAAAMDLRPFAPTAANALARTLMGAVLLAVGKASPDTNEAGESVQLQLRGDGPLGTVMAISDARGRVRGTVERPDVDLRDATGRPDVARAIGLGTLTVVRHRPEWRTPYTGTVPLVSGEIARDITLYLSESEQTPSAMGLGASIASDASAAAAAGFLVQILPGAAAEEIARVEANVRALPPLSQLAMGGADCDDVIDALLEGLGARARHRSEPVFHCPCTRERALRSLAPLGRGELRDMMVRGESQEVVCHFCGHAYLFSSDEIGSVLPDA